MSKPKILIQVDPDSHASVFDSVVAVDSGVDHLLLQPNVSESDVQGLVHGAMFTRGPEDVKSTALFFGGSNVEQTEALVEQAKKCFFGPMRVSLMSDPNGCNTTAAAAVLCAQQDIDLSGKTVTVLAGTGPVGQRIAHLVAGPATEGQPAPTVRVCSRKSDKAQAVCNALTSAIAAETKFEPVQAATAAEALAAIDGSDAVFAAGAAGIELLAEGWLEAEVAPSVAVDLNAVPPAGIHGIEVMDKAEQREDTICYGAIGVGGFKMKIHRRCIQMLFESNDQVLEVEEIYAVGRELMNS
jgi:hypothetical protein